VFLPMKAGDQTPIEAQHGAFSQALAEANSWVKSHKTTG
jgi:hypothetical protein